jgi:anaerobic selenocysteine-containing dehydrogenase
MASPEVRHSVCALDCPDCCSLLINVDPETERGSKLRGDPDHPVTRGFLCGKVAQYLDREYSPERLLHPMKRVGAKGEGKFARISWEEALDTIVEKMRSVAAQFGTEAVLPYSYAGTMGMLNGSSMDRRFFHRFGASQLDRTICSAAGGAAMLASQGISMGTEPEQFKHAKLIIGWGANVLGTNVHLWPFIVEARRNGAKFYTIDPVKNRTGATADKHFFINPGSDMALAFGLAHVILREGLQDQDYIDRASHGFAEFEEKVAAYTPNYVASLTGIAAEEIVALAREYATTRPAVIRVNYGIQRSDRGGNAMRAVLALPVLTGGWKDLGGGLQLSTSGAFQFDNNGLMMPELQQVSPLGRAGRVVNMSQLGHALTELSDPPVKAMVVYNSNPAAIAPNQTAVRRGMLREDLFVAVLEQFQTDTADYADIVLPVTTFLEHTDLYRAYGHYYVQLARPALPAPGECRTNVEIFRELTKRMGFTESCFNDTEDDLIRTALGSGSPFLEGITLDRLEQERSVRLNVGDGPFQPFAEGKFRTASGRFEFGEFEYEPPVESRFGDAGLRAKYPLELISSKNDDSMNSTFGYRADVDADTARLDMTTADAVQRGIADGDRVRVFNDRGSTVLTARVNGAVKQGVVRAPSVRWPKSSPGRAGINVLTAERLTDIGNGPVLFSCLVQVEKCGD